MLLAILDQILELLEDFVLRDRIIVPGLEVLLLILRVRESSRISRGVLFVMNYLRVIEVLVGRLLLSLASLITRGRALLP